MGREPSEDDDRKMIAPTPALRLSIYLILACFIAFEVLFFLTPQKEAGTEPYGADGD